MDWAVVSHAGTREVNEDSAGAVETQNIQCFVVADGLGGHGKGDIASTLAVEAFKKIFHESQESIEETMRSAFGQAQKEILDEQIRTNLKMQMKTTLVSLAITEDSLIWGHIGDTRLYAFSHNRVKTRTLDHSVPQMLVLAKEIKEKEIRNHPDRNKLLRVLGVSGEVPRFELSAIKKRRKFQAFLLCTDGFWEMILEKEMQQCLRKSKTAQEWLEKMEEIIRQRGEGKEMDNFSAIGVFL